MTPHSSPSPLRTPSRPWPVVAPHASSRAKRFTPLIALSDRVPYPAVLTLIEKTANSSTLAADDSTRNLWAKKYVSVSDNALDTRAGFYLIVIRASRHYLISASESPSDEWSLCHILSRSALGAKTLCSARRMFV